MLGIFALLIALVFLVLFQSFAAAGFVGIACYVLLKLEHGGF